MNPEGSEPGLSIREESVPCTPDLLKMDTEDLYILRIALSESRISF